MSELTVYDIARIWRECMGIPERNPGPASASKCGQAPWGKGYVHVFRTGHDICCCGQCDTDIGEPSAFRMVAERDDLP